MNESLTNRQITFILFGIIVGYGVIGLPKNVAENVGTAGWISILIATAITIVFTYMITYLGYVHENKTIDEYSQILTGKFFANIFSIFYFIYYFTFFAMLTRIASEVIRLNVIVKTPVWAIALFFFIVVYYGVIKGLTTIGRICEFYGVVIMFTATFIHFTMFTQGKLINLRPFFGTADIGVYLKGSLQMILPFLGIEVITFIPIHKKNKKRIFYYTTLMVGFIGIFYIMVVESCFAIMGVDDIIHYKDALNATIRRIDIPYLEFFRRLDGLFFLVWIMSIFTTLMLHGYGTVFFISKGLKKIQPNLLAFIVIAGAFIVSQIPKTMDQVEKLLTYNSYLGIFVAAVIPLLLLIITKVKKYDQKTN